MPGTPPQPNKTTLTIVLAALFGAVLIYIAMTYLIPSLGANREQAEFFRIALLVVSLGAVGLGIYIETTMLGRAEKPGQVQAAVVVSAALGESVAIYGLLMWFLAGTREWTLFGISLAYFGRLFLRLPEFHRLMEEKGAA